MVARPLANGAHPSMPGPGLSREIALMRAKTLLLVAAGLVIAGRAAAVTITRGPIIENPDALTSTMTIAWWTDSAGDSTLRLTMWHVPAEPISQLPACGTVWLKPRAGVGPYSTDPDHRLEQSERPRRRHPGRRVRLRDADRLEGERVAHDLVVQERSRCYPGHHQGRREDQPCHAVPRPVLGRRTERLLRPRTQRAAAHGHVRHRLADRADRSVWHGRVPGRSGTGLHPESSRERGHLQVIR